MLNNFLKKTSFILFVVVFFFTGFTAFAQMALSSPDKQQIISNLDTLVQGVNSGDTESIIGLIDPANSQLRSEVRSQLEGKSISYQLDYSPFDEKVEVVDEGEVKIKARFAGAGIGWNVSGLSTYFVFKEKNNQWFIVDTDFYKKLGPGYVFKIFKWIFIFVGPILLAFFGFWIWMLIDCIKRDFDDKALWIILLIFVNFIAAILYYFLIKRKNVVRKPPDFKM